MDKAQIYRGRGDADMAEQIYMSPNLPVRSMD